MGSPSYFGTSYKRISPERYVGYTCTSLLAALAYQHLTVERRPAILAVLFVVLAPVTIHFLLWKRCHLPIAHCLAVSTSSYLAGYMAHDFHIHFNSAETLAIPPPPLHFLLVFFIILELEWLRLYFDVGDKDALYPDFGQMCLTPRTAKFICKDVPQATPMPFRTLLRGWPRKWRIYNTEKHASGR